MTDAENHDFAEITVLIAVLTVTATPYPESGHAPNAERRTGEIGHAKR